MARSTGRFNVLILNADECQVLFKPRDSVVQLVVADGLKRDPAFELMDSLNDCIEEACEKTYRLGQRNENG